jgi:hypothetical protein
VALGTVNAGESGERRLTVRVDDLAAADPLVRLTRAVVASSTAAARASEVTSVAASVSLGLVMVATPDPVGRNAVLTYEVTVTNNGAADAADVQIRMQIPTGMASCQTFSDGGTAPDRVLRGPRRGVESRRARPGGQSHRIGGIRYGGERPIADEWHHHHTTARAQDGGGDTARSATSTAVSQ